MVLPSYERVPLVVTENPVVGVALRSHWNWLEEVTTQPLPSESVIAPLLRVKVVVGVASAAVAEAEDETMRT